MGNVPSDSESPPAPPAPGGTAHNTGRADVDMDEVERLCNTQDFDADEYMVTRRGAKFPVTVHSRSKPNVSSGKLIHASGNEENLEIGSQRTNSSGTTVQVTIPVTAAVGSYTMTLEGTYNNGGSFTVPLKYKVVVLFNAWNREDGVYMENEDYRQEYVRNANGRVYAGSTYGMPWNLGLYRPNSLRAVMHLIENVTTLSYNERRNPILVSREMSALVNVQDDNGVLVGNWSGDYTGGNSPTAWKGSAKILEEYYKSGGRPVRYGQCWVFSGVLLSVLRILGIPSRSVTNFSSAHDTNRNRTVDEYYDENGEKIDYLSSGSDSVWNFHVWNEVWLARPDLPKGFDGWQAVDATPQEESPQGGGYRTGPAPIKAIKDGNSVVYDTNFVIAEVNADIKKYTVGADGAPRLFKVDTTTVGRNISTKAVGSSRRQDVTNDYKYAEGSDWERRALYAGYKELLEEVHEVIFDIPKVDYEFGQNINFEVKVTSEKGRHRVRGTILVEAVAYTGRVLREVQKKRVDEAVSKTSKTIAVTVDGGIFSEFTGTKVYLRFDVLLAVDGTSQIFNEKVEIAPNPPSLKIDAPKKMEIGGWSNVTVTFKNPLPSPMNNVTLTAESEELLADDIEQNVGTIAGGAEFTYTFKVVANKVGVAQLVVGLESDKVELVSGEVEVDIVDKDYVIPPQPTLPPPDPMLIEVTDVNANVQDNRTAHRTQRYEMTGLIIRRGQAFTVTVTTAKAVSAAAKVACRAAFTPIGRGVRTNMFDVLTMSKVEGNQLILSITPPPDCAVGPYRMVITLDNQGKVTVVDKEISCIILFNPWCIEDQCHHPDLKNLEEYVLNNRGRIWVGSARSNYGRAWQFAQFKKDALEVALWILDQLRNQADRRNPVPVTRQVSAYTNVQDDNGILVGNWSGDYSSGTSPTAWTGSAEILKQFNDKKRPVRYGQCWVFSGVMTTLLRTLGIPGRSITNFNSAHDTHFNRAIDKFFGADGEEISSGDSIWNFHVWNESWMARPDLASGFGGWQVLDATPQEESPQGGGYRLGPSSRRAIKLGQRMNYDVEFVISEVNADIRYYTVNADESLTLTRVNTTHVGKNISTKAVGSSAREDVTLDYKFAEGSTSERATLLAETESQKEIGLTVSADDNVEIGQDFFVRATVTNKNSARRNFTVVLHGRTMLYTGAPGQTVKSMEEKITLGGGQSKEIEMHVYPRDYLRILEGGNFISFVGMVTYNAPDPKDNISVVEKEDFRLKTPDIIITLPSGGLKLHVPAAIAVEFKNPLQKRLTNGIFHLHTEGYLQDATAKISTVGPRGTASAVLNTVPLQQGSLTLVVRFTSDQLTDIFGDEEVTIE